MPKLVETEVELALPSLQTANFILKKISLPDASKVEVTELYLQGVVTAAELASLANADDPLEMIYHWKHRAKD